ncbi:hypothetical protein Tcan_18681 [Toxocara canis]|uniref:Uncharacterized protein n=1 Tax=Toxocara canis TaxID=6265 RepID=A0A0B2UWG9_TOXCA|nr:hypothetical protein Tcan_18681 [Toxocara canis]
MSAPQFNVVQKVRCKLRETILLMRDDQLEEPRCEAKAILLGVGRPGEWKEYFTRDDKAFAPPETSSSSI